LTYGRRKLAVLTPEIFTAGWVKHPPQAPMGEKDAQGRVALPDGTIILRSAVAPVADGWAVSLALESKKNVKVIHVRQVVNLAYGEWAGRNFKLGKKKGQVPIEPPENNKLAQARSGLLTLGPHLALGGKALQISAPGLTLALQDNRQWTPCLHAFATLGEPSEPAWVWMKGLVKEYRMVLKLL
jgi:hypothetical protein